MSVQMSAQKPDNLKKFSPPTHIAAPTKVHTQNQGHHAEIMLVPVDQLDIKTPANQKSISQPKQARLHGESPFRHRETYLTPPESEMLRINQRPTAAQDLERAERTQKHNRILKYVGILGLTTIGALAVTFAALKTYIWSPKQG